ncbi:MAG: hypothetical protein ACPGYF_02645 [Chitinophagales bacterium]
MKNTLLLHILLPLLFLGLSSCDSSKEQNEAENEETSAVAKEEEAAAEEEEAAAEDYELFQWNEISKKLEAVGTKADYTKSGWILKKEYNTFDGDRYLGYALDKKGDYGLHFELAQISPTGGDTTVTFELVFALSCLERNHYGLNDATKFFFAVDENKSQVFEWRYTKSSNPNRVMFGYGLRLSEKKILQGWDIAEMLKSGSKLEIRIESKTGKKTDLTFDLSGFSSVFKAVGREYLDNIDGQKVY